MYTLQSNFGFFGLPTHYTITYLPFILFLLYKIILQPQDISWFPSLGIPRLELENPRWNSYVGHWNSYVRIPMSNIGIPTWVFSFLPRFLPNLMIFIISINLSSFIGTIYIEKLSNFVKNLGRNEKTHIGIPTLDIGIPKQEFQCPTQEFRRRNSNSNLGIPRLGNRLLQFQLNPHYAYGILGPNHV